jgi:DNA-binding CsgD family transcriptional regulator
VANPNDVIELAHRCAGCPEFFGQLLVMLRTVFANDVAALHLAAAYPVTGGGPLATLGYAPAVRRACARRWPRYLDELEPIAHVAVKTQSVTTDRRVFSASERARMAIYKEFVAPQGTSETLVGYLSLRKQPIAALSLGRSKGSWSAQAQHELVAWLPALSVAVASARMGQEQQVHGAALTPQERRVLGGIEAGLSNAEIALSCGSSVNTVRNQVASLLEKLDLSSRSQLAALGLTRFVEQHG